MPGDQLKVFAGSSNKKLASSICQELGIELGNCLITQFADGEIRVEIGEMVRNSDIYIVEPTSAPANDNLMELLIMIDAMKRASAKSICAVIPYFGYARQDRKVYSRSPITAKLVADLLMTAGATRVISMDLHAGQIQGFFNIPVDHIFAMPVMLADIRAHHNPEELVIVSPDAGGVERARAYSKRLACSLAIIDKRRPEVNVCEVMHVIGEVKGKKAILVDDMVDTAGTIIKAAEALVKAGATEVYAYATHPVLSADAAHRLYTSPIREFVSTDTIPIGSKIDKCPSMRIVSVAPLLAKAIERIHTGESISSLFI